MKCEHPAELEYGAWQLPPKVQELEKELAAARKRIEELEALLRRGLVVRCIHGDYIHTVPDPVLPNTWHAIDDTPDKWAADVQKSLDPGPK